MLTIDHENYIRFILLLLQAGTDLLREIIQKALKSRGETLDQVLHSFHHAISNDRKLTRIQKDTMYPSNAQCASIEDFDITLLSHLINNYLNKDINQLEMDATNEIQQWRNKYHAHTTDAKMDAITYNKEWTKLVRNIIKVDTGMSSEVGKRHVYMIDHIGDDSIDIMALLKEIQKLDMSKVFFESIQHSLESVQTDLQDIKTTVQNTAGAVACVGTDVSHTKAEIMDTKTKVMAEVLDTKTEVMAAVMDTKTGVMETKTEVVDTKAEIMKTKAEVMAVAMDTKAVVMETKAEVTDTKAVVIDAKAEVMVAVVETKAEVMKTNADVMDTKTLVMDTNTVVMDTKTVVLAEVMDTKAEVMQVKDLLVHITQQMENQGRKTKIVQTMYGKVYLSADDQETIDQAEADLLEASNNNVAKKEPTDLSHKALQEKVDLVVKDIEKLDVKVVGVSKGSIIFEFKCQTLTAILDLIDYFYSSKFQRRLDDIAQALEDITGKQIYITAVGIDRQSVKNVIYKLQKKEYEKVVQFELSCPGVDGLLHILEVFEEGKAANSMNELSKALSDKVGKPVTLHTSIDMDQIKKAIQTIKDQLGDSSSDSSIEDFSGIKQPPLLDQLKIILDEYRNDVQIIKELVQNADDAEASEMKILYDGRILNEEHPNEKKYRMFLRAPALAFYNDAMFTDADWKGIKSIYSSVKKEDPLKIGRFGLGFKSVFHLTDYPCIISGKNVLFINPHERQSGKVCVTVKLKNLRKWRKLNIKDFMNAINGTFGFSEKTLDEGHYPGTMFWFPLRQTPSVLSEDVYKDADVLGLIQAFISESHRSLIFLKTLCSVEIFVNLQASTQDDISSQKRKKRKMSRDTKSLLDEMYFGKDVPFYGVRITNTSNDLERKRAHILKELKEIGDAVPNESKYWVHDVFVSATTKTVDGNDKMSKARWLIVNYLKGGEISERINALKKDKDLLYPHLVGLAAPIVEDCSYSSTAGHVFCYQPLPQESSSFTGLPVHVNAFFALTQNRRHIRWPDDDDQSLTTTDKKIEWNLRLLSEIFPYAYVQLVSEMVKLSKSERNKEYLREAVYNTIPSITAAQPHWRGLANDVLKLCLKQKKEMFYTKSSGNWIPAEKAVIPYETTAIPTAEDLLLNDKVNVCKVPDHVVTDVRKLFPDLKHVTPMFIRQHLVKSPSYKQLSFDKKQDLLELVLQESSTEYLDDIELIPLADSKHCTFSGTNPVFGEAEDIISIFPGHEARFLSTDLRQDIMERLKTVSFEGDHCIQIVNAEVAKEMLHKIISSNFKTRPKVRPKNAEKWKPWIQKVWTFIQTRFKHECRVFKDLELFPVLIHSPWDLATEFHMNSLRGPFLHLKPSVVVKKENKVRQGLALLSITCVKYVPDWIDKGFVQHFVHDSIADSLSQTSDDNVRKYNKNSTAEVSDAVLTYFSEWIHTELSTTCKERIRHIKLFKARSSSKEFEVVSLTENNKILDTDGFPVNFPAKLIVLNSDLEKRFAKILGGEIVSASEIAMDAILMFDSYSTDEQKRLVSWIIKNDKVFEDDLLQQQLKKTNFLRCADNKLHKPSDLFDPTDKFLVEKLFRNQNLFPVLNEYDPVFMKRLQSLGLKTRDQITSDDIDKQCSLVHEMSSGKTQFDESKCLALLKVMNEKYFLVKKEHILSKQCIFALDKVDLSSKSLTVKTHDKASLLRCPTEVKSLDFSSLISSVHFTIDTRTLSHLSKVFGWSEPPKVADVVNHLLNIVKTYDQTKKAKCLPMVTEVYEWLKSQKQCPLEEVKSILNDVFSAQEAKYVWVGSGFQPPEKVFVTKKEGDIEMTPFLFELPSEMQGLSEFFIALGCCRFLDFRMHIRTLEEIKIECDKEMKKRICRDSRALALAIDILNKLKNDFLKNIEGSNIEVVFPVHVRVKGGSLKFEPAKRCTYCDAQWLQDMIEDDIIEVHPDVPIATAEALGVPSLRQQLLSNAEAFEEWGQEEPLTRRLRTLLKEGYVDGFSVAKELFQNADDAGARKLWILYDERENNDAKTHLLSDNMVKWQGPAIWAFNDALFTAEDLKNITKLSGATKGNDTTKIGKFGLGFCAVYNLTDVPSFISGENLVIFDPHTTFLGKALPGKSPGLRINFRLKKNAKMLNRMKNQFKPFEGVFDCKILNCSPNFPGTLFRLPLRTSGSDISDTVYTPSEVIDLLRMIMKLSSNMLLFNQNVAEIKIFHLPKNINDPSQRKLLFEAEKALQTLLTTENRLYSQLEEASKRKRKNQLDSPYLSFQQNTIKGKRLKNTQFQQKKSSFSNTWLVSWATGSSERTLKMTKEEEGALCLGAVAVPIKFRKSENKDCQEMQFLRLQEVEAEFYAKGHVFFFLPLPIEHNFRFHINGQFGVTPDRRHLNTSTEDDRNTKMKDWNECLLSDPVILALLHLLENVHKVGELPGYRFYQLWPMFETGQLLKCVPEAFYRHIVLPGAYKVFERDGVWFDITQCVLIERTFRRSTVGEIAFQTLSMLTKHVVDVTEDIYNFLKLADVKLVSERTVNEQRFFLEFFFPNLAQFDTDRHKIERNELLCYAVRQNNDLLKKWLKNNPSIPSRPSGERKRPCELVNPASQLSELFEEVDGRFPDKTFDSDIVIKHLKDLGLIHDVLPDDLVIDRAESVEKVSFRCKVCAAIRSGLLIAYLSTKQDYHQNCFSVIRHVNFIPVKSKPLQWPFVWKGDDKKSTEISHTKLCHPAEFRRMKPIHFDKASNVFHSDCKYLVGCLHYIFEERFCMQTRFSATPQDVKHALKRSGMQAIWVGQVAHALVLEQLQTLIATKVTKINKSEFESAIKHIYKYLDDKCKERKDNGEIEMIITSLRRKRCVWVTDQFVLPDIVAEHCPADCQPHLFGLRQSLLFEYKYIVQCIDIVKYFAPKFIGKIIQSIKETNGENRLTSEEVSKVISLLKYLQKSLKMYKIYNADKILDDELPCIYGPDEHGVLRDCKAMCFNDYDGIEKSESMIYANGFIPPDLAKCFGVKPKIIFNLKENSEDVEDFFQNEPLITRLKRLVEGYPCDSGIFKELIQNADDARATEIHFLLDNETHPCVNIMNPEFAPLQGPALCVFNNSAFSNEDLKGITKLGKGSKGDDPSKTGRYGVGFNSVYNITDAPSFYTIGGDIENGETLCFFDPMARYIPNVSKAKPGKRYKNILAFKKYHSDVMTGYHADFFMNKPGEKGTVFRLPLRSPEMADESEIKSEPVDVASINGHLDKFCKEAQDMLVFLKNLRTIVVSENVKRGRIYEYQEVFRVNVVMQSDKDTRVNFVQAQNTLCKDCKVEKEKVLTFKQQSFKYEMEMTVKNTKLKTKDFIKYIVVQTVGFKEPEKIPVILKQNILKGNIGLLPHGGVALCTSADPANTSTKAYCFLPLPIHTGLPVHIHGYFALDHEVRRSLYKDENKDSCPKTLWNSTLIRQVISPAYALLLQHAQFQIFSEFAHSTSIYRSVLEKLTIYQHLFPNLEDLTDEYWKEILKGVFDVLVSEYIPFLPVLRTTLQPSRYVRSEIATRLTNLSWTPLYEIDCNFPAYFKAESGIDDKDNKQSDLNNILRDVGMRIVDCDHIIRSALKYSGHKLKEVEPKDVTDFISSFNSEKIGNCLIKTDQQIDQGVLQTPRKLRHLLKYCLQDLDCFVSVILNLPLFLTQDCVLSTLPQQGFFYVEKSGRFSDLFPSKLNQFLHSEISPLIAGKVSGYEQKSQSKLKEFSLQQCVILISETEATQIVSNYIVWDKQTPSAIWVQRFWEFFYQLDFNFDRELISSKLNVVRDLALIPAKDSLDQQILIAPRSRNILLDIESFSENVVLYEAFLQLKIPEIDKTLLKPGVLRMLLDQIPRFDSAVDVVESLHLNIDAFLKAELSQEQARCIIRYFNVNLATISTATGDMLKRLPLFVSHFGQIVSLTTYTRKAVVPYNLPKFGLEDLATHASVLLLQDVGCTQLFENLGIPLFTLEKVYTNFIVPNQEKLQRNDFYEHVRCIARLLYNEDSEDAIELISMLRNTKFVMVANGKLVFVRELFDPSIKVFQHFCGPDELVPTELRSLPVLELFKRLGMTTEMNMRLFERFAKDIENTGLEEGLTENVHKSSVLLTSALFKMRTEFFETEPFAILCNIRFVLPLNPSVDMTSICKAFNNNQLICFKGSLLESKKNTCWTVASILSSEASPSSSKSDLCIRVLQIERKTGVQDLITHFKNVGESVRVKEKLPNSINHDFLKAVIEDILQAMDDFRNTNELRNDLLEMLKNVPIIYIPAIKQMLPASVVVLECKENEQIQPYLNKCPDEFIKYKELFLRLGARKELSCDAYVSVLSALTIDCGDSNILLAKGKIDGVKAMSMLFHFLSLSPEEITIPQDCLYLVSNEYKLQKAVNLIAENDSVLFKTVTDNYKGNRVWFLLDIAHLEKCNIRKEIFIDTLNRLPQCHRPRLLTDIVKSRILLKDIKLEDGTHAQHFEKFLHSQSFFNGFIRLVRHAWKDHGDTWSIEEESRIASHLEKVRFKHASGIKTVLALTEKINEEPVNEVMIENSQEEKNVHLEENSEGVCVYFNIRDVKWLENVKTDLSIYLNEFIQRRLKDKMLMTLREIVGVFENPNQVRIILSKEKIPEYESKIEVKESLLYPRPGSFVPREFHQYLDNDFGVFYPYEYKFIALELDDPAFEENEGSEGEENDINIEFSSTFIYVHILEKNEPENTFSLLQEYKIDDGSGIPRTVKALKLFKFINKIENTNTERDIVLYTGTSSSDKIPVSLKAAYAEVRKFLLEAWGQPENVRKLLVKRLLFKWHPDKYPEKVSFCTKVFQFIQQCLHRLEKGLDLPEVPDDDVNRDTGETWNWSSSWYGRYWRRYERYNRYNRDEFHAGSRSRDSSFRFFGFWDSSYSSHNRTESATEKEPYHWYSEGRRWQRQAETDYANSRLFLQSTPCETFNWVCYKVHQAVEKSLKAAWYAKDANQIDNVKYSHNITSIASGLGSDLVSLAGSFSNLVGDHSRMRYPDMYSGHVIPADAFSRQTAESAIQLARQILDKVQKDFIR